MSLGTNDEGVIFAYDSPFKKGTKKSIIFISTSCFVVERGEYSQMSQSKGQIKTDFQNDSFASKCRWLSYLKVSFAFE